MEFQQLLHIQSLLKHASSLHMHVVHIDADDLYLMDGGARKRLENSATLYTELRQTLKNDLQPGTLLHLQDSLCLHYVVFSLPETPQTICGLGPFVTDSTEENSLLLHIQKELDLPYLLIDDVLTVAQSILLLIGQAHTWPVNFLSLQMDPTLLVQLTSGQYQGSHAVIRRIVYYIQAHLSNKLTLEGLSEYFGFSPTYISHHFKEEVGIPPMQYIANQKMLYAQHLLRTTDKAIHEIATGIGITDWSYFTKRFREHAGCTPSQYRKLHK